MFLGALVIVACGSDSSSNGKSESVKAPSELPECNSETDGQSLFVESENADYVCEGGKWNSGMADAESSSSAKPGSSCGNSGTSSAANSSSSEKAPASSSNAAIESGDEFPACTSELQDTILQNKAFFRKTIILSATAENGARRLRSNMTLTSGVPARTAKSERGASIPKTAMFTTGRSGAWQQMWKSRSAAVRKKLRTALAFTTKPIT